MKTTKDVVQEIEKIKDVLFQDKENLVLNLIISIYLNILRAWIIGDKIIPLSETLKKALKIKQAKKEKK